MEKCTAYLFSLKEAEEAFSRRRKMRTLRNRKRNGYYSGEGVVMKYKHWCVGVEFLN